jgi:tRNA A-37 threonylcarbamoyl transferase component Bud32
MSVVPKAKWMVGAMERSEAEAWLTKSAQENGAAPDVTTFCVRTGNRGLTISALNRGKLSHVPVTQSASTLSVQQAGRVVEATTLELLLVALGYDAPAEATYDAELPLVVTRDYAPPPLSSSVFSNGSGATTPASAAAGPAHSTKSGGEWRIDPAELNLGKILGQGHFGTVRKAKWNGVTVAVKQLRDDVPVRSADAELDFERELARMQALQPHKHVVSFFGVAQAKKSDGVLAIVVEFCGGGSLETALLKPTTVEAPAAQWSKKLRLHIAYGIACGIAHLHRALIVHRDIAARNVLLTTVDGVVVPKVADFGMSRVLENVDAEQATVNVVGPLKWMAPEQIDGRRYSIKSDVYSFATTLFELFTQCKPWADLSNRDAALAIADGQQLRWPGDCAVPRHIVKLTRQCWSLAPADRPTMMDVQADLECE